MTPTIALIFASWTAYACVETCLSLTSPHAVARGPLPTIAELARLAAAWTVMGGLFGLVGMLARIAD